MCHSALALETLRREGDEVVEGFFTCGCGIQYPVIQGVPRMLPPPLLSALVADYPEFFRPYAERMSPTVGAQNSRDAKVKRATQEAFGYEWTWAADYHAVNFADWLPADCDAHTLFPGRVGLEVGCGAGRHAALTESLAKEHIAVDLSRAVDSAFSARAPCATATWARPTCFTFRFSHRRSTTCIASECCNISPIRRRVSTPSPGSPDRTARCS